MWSGLLLARKRCRVAPGRRCRVDRMRVVVSVVVFVARSFGGIRVMFPQQ